MGSARVTQHAIERYMTRVDPWASRERARACVEQIVACGHVRPTPRHWMRHRVGMTPGLRFVYWAEQPDVCALVLDGSVVTMVNRGLYSPLSLPEMSGSLVSPSSQEEKLSIRAGVTAEFGEAA